MAVFLRTFGEEFEILVLVNLDESDAIGAVLALQHVWFLVSKKVFDYSPRLAVHSERDQRVSILLNLQ